MKSIYPKSPIPIPGIKPINGDKSLIKIIITIANKHCVIHLMISFNLLPLLYINQEKI